MGALGQGKERYCDVIHQTMLSSQGLTIAIGHWSILNRRGEFHGEPDGHQQCDFLCCPCELCLLDSTAMASAFISLRLRLGRADRAGHARHLVLRRFDLARLGSPAPFS